MPSGKTHDRITLWGLPWVVLLALFGTRNATLALIISCTYLFSGLMFGPDLDIYSIQFKRWGWLRWVWLPYQRAISHRSKLSHGPIIGTCIRLLYLLVVVLLSTVLGVAIAQFIFGFTWNWQAAGQWLLDQLMGQHLRVVAVFVGLELGAMSHAMADWLGSRYKRQQRQKKRQPQTRKSKSKP